MKTRVILSLLVCGALAAMVRATGSLTPPPGPVMPTMKTLDEVEPRIAINAMNTPGDPDSLFKITQKGSYYLTGNVTGVSGKHGIEIDADGDVAIDGNGFLLEGVPGSLSGIKIAPSALRSHAGKDLLNFILSIAHWGAHGIDAGGAILSLNNVAIQNCGGDGIHFNGDGTVNSQDLTVSGNGGDGIHVGGGGHANLEDLTILLNAGDGVEISDSAVLRNVILQNNTGAAVNILAGARGVNLSDLAALLLNASGPALLDNGTGTVIRNMSVDADGVNTDSLVLLGADGSTGGLAIRCANSMFSGPVVDVSAGKNAINDFSCLASNATASSILRIDNPKPWGPNSIVSATDCTLTTAVVNITGDGGSFSGSVQALGTTSAPSLIRLAGNNCSLVTDTAEGILRPSPNTPIGIDVIGDDNIIGGLAIQDVPVGGIAVRIDAGASRTQIKNLSVTGSGMVLDDMGTICRVDDLLAVINIVNTSSIIKMGASSTLSGSLSVDGGTCSGAIVDASAQAVSIGDFAILAANVTAPSAASVNGGWSHDKIVATNCTFATAVVNIIGDGSSFGGSVEALGTTLAPSLIRLAGNSCSIVEDTSEGILRPSPNTPIGIDVTGLRNTIAGVVIKDVPSGGTGIRVLAGANGNQIDHCRIGGSGAGQITAISIAGDNNLLINNRINALLGGMAFDNTGAGNVIGPIANAANIAALHNPAVNYLH